MRIINNIGWILPYIFALILPSYTFASDMPLKGCAEPSGLAGTLGILRQNDWHEMSIAWIEAKWPFALEALWDGSQRDHRLLESQSRIIRGHCECCEIFNFDITTDDRGKKTEHLQSVTIHYSTRERATAVRVASDFAKALGLANNEADTIGRGSAQNFQWADSSKRVLNALELRFAQKEDIWEIFLAISRDYVSRPATE